MPTQTRKPCGAPLKRRGFCKQPATAKGRCSRHGGRIKDGRWSAFIAPHLRRHYLSSANDPDLLALRHDIALLDAHIAELLTRVHTGESGTLWFRLKTVNQELNRARKDQNKDLFNIKVSELRKLIEYGVEDSTVRFEIRELMKLRHRLVEAEQKRLITARMLIPIEDAKAFAQTLNQIVAENVTDQTAIAAIAAAFDRLYAERNDPVLEETAHLSLNAPPGA